MNMKSYELIGKNHAPAAVEQIRRVVNKLDFLGLVIIHARPGWTPSVRVQPNAATRLLESVYTGQGWEAGRMYKSYAAVIDGVKIVWHKPMRAPAVLQRVSGPRRHYSRAAQ